VHKTTVYLPDDLRVELEAAARMTGESQADLIRKAIRDYLAEQPRALPASIGAHRSGTFAARDDEAVLESAWGPRQSHAGG
jgi:metal-responsive CopG/Arc/MetJ family transcriptional regulator